MSDQRYPSEKLDQYMLRLPDGMRDKIKDAAAANNRSMNAEIVARLSASLDTKTAALASKGVPNEVVQSVAEGIFAYLAAEGWTPPEDHDPSEDAEHKTEVTERRSLPPRDAAPTEPADTPAPRQRRTLPPRK